MKTKWLAFYLLAFTIGLCCAANAAPDDASLVEDPLIAARAAALLKEDDEMQELECAAAGQDCSTSVAAERKRRVLLAQTECNKKRWQSDLERQKECLRKIRQSQEGIKSLVLSDVKLAKENVPGWGVLLQLTNHSDKTITRVELTVELMSEGRTVPWAKDQNIGWNLPGGLQPGESRRCRLTEGKEDGGPLLRDQHGVVLGALSRWWQSLPARDDYRLTVQITTAYDDSFDMFANAKPNRFEYPLWQLNGCSYADHFETAAGIIATQKKIEKADRLIEELSPKDEGDSAEETDK